MKKGPDPLPDRAFGASKPVSRVLSFKTAIYLGVPLPARSSHLLNAAGPACCVTTVLLRIEFTAMSSFQSSGGRLSPPFHPYPVAASSIPFASAYGRKPTHSAAPPLPKRTASPGSFRKRGRRETKKDIKLAATRRYISVALFLKSPSAGVTRYPCPVEPGLSS